MTKITESQIETLAMELLEKQGYQYIYNPNIILENPSPLPLGENKERIPQ